jgi:5S rRNA maturation endonuclease (ribonuclease M5)
VRSLSLKPVHSAGKPGAVLYNLNQGEDMANSGKSKNDRRSLDDVKRENSMMDKKLREKGIFFDLDENGDHFEHNKFLRHIMECEGIDITTRKVKSFFPPGYKFPKVEKMSPEELERKLEEILTILEDNRVDVSLTENLPDNLIYNFIIENVIPAEVTVSPLSAGFEVFDGCRGDCEECFQKDYCETAKEELAES